MKSELRTRLEDLRAVVIRAAGERDGLWIVGGAVRDALLDTTSLDLDVTGADAEDAAKSAAAKLRARAVPIGSDPITWRIAAGGMSLDFAPLQGADITADLLRRDFTINALAIPLAGALEPIDPAGGLDDIEQRRLRMVRPSNFDDDPLRVLRAVRFATTHRLSIEPATAAELRSRAKTITRAAPERIRYELTRMLEADPARAIDLLLDLELAVPAFGVEVDPSTRVMLARVTETPTLAVVLAVVYRESPAEEVSALLRDGKWPGDVVNRVTALVRATTRTWHDPSAAVLPLYDLGRDLATELVDLLAAIDRAGESQALQHFITSRGSGWWNTRPLLRGDEIAEISGASGPAIGAASRRLLEAQLRGEVASREEAERVVRALTPSA